MLGHVNETRKTLCKTFLSGVKNKSPGVFVLDNKLKWFQFQERPEYCLRTNVEKSR